MESQRTIPLAPAWQDSIAGDDTTRARFLPAHGRRTREPPHAPLLLDRYRLLERLGRGGFGEVWRARDERLQRDVALKRVVLGPGGDSERAAREAHAAARLSHPAIVALYEARAHEDCFYLISELVHGHTLAHHIARDTLADEEVLAIGAALAAALAHAHARGVIHRDIKPPNVLVPREARSAGAAAKLTDFGGASLVGEDALTRTGDVLGTLAYMAPEQSEGREVGAPADVYALALVLYEALCGENPVRGATPAATARRIGQAIPPLARRRRDLPRALTSALDDALLPDPGERGALGDLATALALPVERRRAATLRMPRLRAAPLPATAAAVQVHPPGAGAPAPAEVPVAAAPAQQAPAPAPAREPVLALPRVVWVALALAAIIWQLAAGRSGVALLALAALAPLALAPIGRHGRRRTPAWLACALAPVLGTLGLAAVFPALAGQRRRWPERAAMGALGFWWLTLAEPLLARRLWAGPPAGAPARAAWEGSLGLSAAHVVGPCFAGAVLLGAAVWACGALALPWVVRGVNAPFDLLAACAWSIALAIMASAAAAHGGAHGLHGSPRGLVLGSVLAALFAVGARAVRGPV